MKPERAKQIEVAKEILRRLTVKLGSREAAVKALEAALRQRAHRTRPQTSTGS